MENVYEKEFARDAAVPKFSTLAARARIVVKQSTASFRHSRIRCERILSLVALAGDLTMILSGFLLAFWFRYYSGAFQFLVPLPVGNPPGTDPIVLWNYWRLLALGVLFVFGGLISKGSYEHRDLLALRRFLYNFTGILTFGLFIFIGLTLAVQTSPPISRAFVLISWAAILLTVGSWRFLLSRALRHPSLVRRLRKRLLVVGATQETVKLQNQLKQSLEYEYVGWVEGTKPNRFEPLQSTRLGALHNLEKVLADHRIEMAVLTETEAVQREGIAFILKVCEREHVQFKLVPNFMEILISGLSPSNIGGVPLLGVDSLPLQAYQNRALKRTVDIIGATVGLVLAAPLIAFFGALVALESPGPIIYRQIRAGRNGRLFQIYKIRSMRMDAEASGKPGWTSAADPRRLKIGAFLRKWNLDELPQFWNVMKGDMSLVGPRPERPELINHFKHIIPHYQIRHQCRAGMTGWAQVNGWRGDTDLEERIRCDIWYVEHWNLFLDFRVMLLTFFRSKNAC